MPRGVWKDTTPGKRSAAAKKAARSRGRQTDRAKLRAYLAGKGPPLSAPERGGAADRVMQGPQISELMARIRAHAKAEAAE